MQEAFLISRPVVHDDDLWQQYARQAVPLATSYGGSYIVKSREVSALDGTFAGGMVVIMRFPDIDQFHAFWNSPEYQALRDIRLAASTGDVWLVPGAIQS